MGQTTFAERIWFESLKLKPVLPVLEDIGQTKKFCLKNYNPPRPRVLVLYLYSITG